MPPKELDLARLQRTTLHYLLHETNPDNGLVRDKTDPAAPCSIAALGMALAILPVVIESGVFFRPFAAKVARRRLRFLYDLPQGPEANASGYKGFFYHFLWKQIYDRELLYSGPLFTHQLSHLWIDFRGIRDAFMRDHNSDYFENSRRATFVHQAATIIPTTSKTAAGLRSCIRPTPCTIRCSSSAMENTAGDSRPATAPAG